MMYLTVPFALLVRRSTAMKAPTPEGMVRIKGMLVSRGYLPEAGTPMSAEEWDQKVDEVKARAASLDLTDDGANLTDDGAIRWLMGHDMDIKNITDLLGLRQEWLDGLDIAAVQSAVRNPEARTDDGILGSTSWSEIDKSLRDLGIYTDITPAGHAGPPVMLVRVKDCIAKYQSIGKEKLKRMQVYGKEYLNYIFEQRSGLGSNKKLVSAIQIVDLADVGAFDLKSVVGLLKALKNSHYPEQFQAVCQENAGIGVRMVMKTVGSRFMPARTLSKMKAVSDVQELTTDILPPDMGGVNSTCSK